MEDTQNNSQPAGTTPGMPVVGTAPTITAVPQGNPMGADIIRPTAMPQAPVEAPVNNFPVEGSAQPATDFSIAPTPTTPAKPSDINVPAGMTPLSTTTPNAPKKKSNTMVLVVLVVAVVLAAVAVFVYLNSNKKTTTTKATVVAPAVAAKPATSADVTKLSTDLDASIAIADATQDITSNDLTNTALGL